MFYRNPLLSNITQSRSHHFPTINKYLWSPLTRFSISFRACDRSEWPIAVISCSRSSGGRDFSGRSVCSKTADDRVSIWCHKTGYLLLLVCFDFSQFAFLKTTRKVYTHTNIRYVQLSLVPVVCIMGQDLTAWSHTIFSPDPCLIQCTGWSRGPLEKFWHCLSNNCINRHIYSGTELSLPELDFAIVFFQWFFCVYLNGYFFGPLLPNTVIFLRDTRISHPAKNHLTYKNV